MLKDCHWTKENQSIGPEKSLREPRLYAYQLVTGSKQISGPPFVCTTPESCKVPTIRGAHYQIKSQLCLQYAAEVLSNNEHFRLDDSYGLCIMLQPAWPSTLLQILNISISAIFRAIFFVASSVDPIFHHPH